MKIKKGQKKDWRLTNQEKYLKGKDLYWRKWKKPKPTWDHDHCSFCWATFSDDPNIEDAISEGYCIKDAYYWICEKCFEDFCDIFRWKFIKNNEDI